MAGCSSSFSRAARALIQATAEMHPNSGTAAA